MSRKKINLKKYVFCCPNCNHGFLRNCEKLSRKTSCPKCRTEFIRSEGLANDIDKKRIKENCLAKTKVNGSAAALINISEDIKDEIIHGLQIPNSRSEAAFKARAIEKGWKPHRPSWPDFLIETEFGLIAVEVKSNSDSVSVSQKMTFDLLESNGIPVYLWRNSKGSKGKLIKWNRGLALHKAGY